VPGIVDEHGRVVACDVIRGLDGFVLTLPGIKTAVLNDTAAGLVAAREDFAPTATAVLVMVGTAVGAAFQMNGVVARGAKGWAGELGYVPIHSEGTVRHLDDVAGGSSILRRAGLSAEELTAGLAAKDVRLLELVRFAGQALGLGLATLVNLLNPDVIVLGGGTLGYAGYVDTALAQAEASSLPELWRCCRVIVTPHGERLVARGAASAALAA
jgi:predicted NBD/HSP70 family sugar kinase